MTKIQVEMAFEKLELNENEVVVIKISDNVLPDYLQQIATFAAETARNWARRLGFSTPLPWLIVNDQIVMAMSDDNPYAIISELLQLYDEILIVNGELLRLNGVDDKKVSEYYDQRLQNAAKIVDNAQLIPITGVERRVKSFLRDLPMVTFGNDEIYFSRSAQGPEISVTVGQIETKDCMIGLDCQGTAKIQSSEGQCIDLAEVDPDNLDDMQLKIALADQMILQWQQYRVEMIRQIVEMERNENEQPETPTQKKETLKTLSDADSFKV